VERVFQNPKIRNFWILLLFILACSNNQICPPCVEPTQTPGISFSPTRTPQAVSTPTEGGSQATAIPSPTPFMNPVYKHCVNCGKVILCWVLLCPDCNFPQPSGACPELSLLKDHHNKDEGVPGKSVEGLRPAAHLDAFSNVILLRKKVKVPASSCFVEKFTIRIREPREKNNYYSFPGFEAGNTKGAKRMFGWSVDLQRRKTKLAEEELLDKVRNIWRFVVDKPEKREKKV
jgi:hypothetical protein